MMSSELLPTSHAGCNKNAATDKTIIVKATNRKNRKRALRFHSSQPNTSIKTNAPISTKLTGNVV